MNKFSHSPDNSASVSQRIGVYLLSAAMVLQPTLGWAADPVAANANTSVYNAENGVAVVDIARANAAGLSHNKFDSYDVDARGLVLNNGNSDELLRQSQLAGQVAANLNLANQASVILNEVVSPNRSQLNGYTEVLGGTADVIVANPYGISCNGCGFINTPNVTLTTGLPQLDAAGGLSGFRVNSGDILISGNGINASSAEVLSLVTPALALQGQVNAQELNVSVGLHDWNYKTRAASAALASGAGYGLDSSALGGMYANRIRIQASGAGVGVKMLGDAAASAGEFTINADGQIVLKNQISAEGDIAVNTASSVAEALQISDASLSTKNELALAAAGGVELVGGTLVAKSIGIDAGSLSDTASAHTSADNNKRHGDTVSINSAGDVNLDSTAWSGANAVSVNADGLALNSASISSGGSMSLSTDADMSLGDSSVSSAGDMSLVAEGRVSTQSGTNQGVQSTSGNISINAATGVDNDGVVTADSGDVLVRADGVINNSGTLHAQQVLDIADKNNGMTAVVTNSGTLLSDGQLTAKASSVSISSDSVVRGDTVNMDVAQLTIDDNGALNSTSDTTLNIQNLSFGGSSSRIVTAINGGTANINLGSAFNNVGAIHSGGDLNLNLPALTNTDTGGISALGTLSINATAGDVFNAGALYAGQLLDIKAKNTITNYATNVGFMGEMDSSGSMNFTAGTFINNSRIDAAQDITVSADIFRNEIPGGVSVSWGDYTSRDTKQTGHRGKGYLYGCCDHYEEWDYKQTWHREQKYDGGKPSFNPQLIGGGTVTIRDFSNAVNVGAVISGHAVNLLGKLGSTFTNSSLPIYRDDLTRTYTLQTKWIAAGGIGHYHVKKLIRDSGDGTKTTILDELDAGIFANSKVTTTNTNLVNKGNALKENGAKASNVTSATTPTASNINFDGINLNLPTNPNGYFVPNQDPSSQYLVETNPLFSIGSNYLGSDYLTDRLGYDPDEVQRRLGDAAYENHLIQQQIIEQTGRNILAGYESEAAQVKSFLDAASEQFSDLNLELGKELNSTQISQLQSDIVWMVEREVAGEKVLVPVVYLSQASIEGITSGAVIAAVDISMDLESLTNTGGTIIAENSMAIISEGDITNTGGSIHAEDMILASTDGKIINETVVTRFGSADNYQDVAGSTGSISANNSLVLSADQGIDIIGATVDAGGSATLYSENGDINIESLALESKATTHESSSGFFNSSQSTTVETNQTALNAGVSAGGNLNIVAENGDVDLLGAELSSGEDLNIAGTNVNSMALNLVSTKTVSETTSGITASGIGTASSSSSSYSSTGQGSTITAGNVMSINASNDIVLEGGTYNATAGVLNAGNNVTTIATKDISNESSSSSFAGLGANGIGAESQSTTTNSTTHQNADLTFGDSLSITAGNTVDIGGMDATITNRAEPEAPPAEEPIVAQNGPEETEFVEATPEAVDPVAALVPGFDVAKLREAMAEGDVASYTEEVADNGMGFADTFAQPGENAVVGSLNINANKVVSTKFQDTTYTAESSSSANVGFFSVDVESSTSEHATTSDNINTLSAANVSINGTESIDLKGVDIQGDDLIHLKSEGDISISAAEKQETFSASSHSTHVGFDGINVSSSSVEGMNKGHDDSKLTTEGLLSIESGGDVTFTGVTAEADTLGIQAENFTSAAYKDESTLKESSDTFALGFSGVGQESKTLDINATQEVGNTIIANNALIDVQDNVTIVGGDVIANNLAINAHTVDIVAAESTWDEKKTQSGFSLTASGNAAFLGNRATASASSMGSAGSALGKTGKGFSGLADQVNSAANVEPEAQVTSDVIAATSGNDTEGEDNVSHNGKAATGELVNAKVGLTISSSEETINSTTYQNANLSFGNLTINTVGNSDEGDGHVDIGGANLVSLEGIEDSSIIINTGELKTTKYIDDTKTTFKENTTFIGHSSEVHSAAADAANNTDALVDKANDGMELDAGLVAAQAGADASNLVMGDLAGGTTGLEVSNTHTEMSSHSTSENTNYISAANISITTTEGNIDLKGVQFTAPPVFNEETGKMEASTRAQAQSISLDSAQDVNLTAAKSTHSETSTSTTHTANVSLYGSASAMGSSVGLDAGYNGNTETTTLDSTSYQNAQLNADNVSIKGENLNLTGANVGGDSIEIDIANNINVTSVQDTQTKTTTRSNWGGSVGVSAGTYGLAPSVNAQGGGGESRDNFAKTAQQSGIQAENSLDIAAGGDLTLTGANIGVAKGGRGKVDIKGDVVANQLNDVHDKSGGFYGGGGGFDAGGVNVNVDIEVVDKIDQKITQNSTITGVDLTVGGELKGDNLSADGQLQTEQSTTITDRRIAGVHIVGSGFAPTPKRARPTLEKAARKVMPLSKEKTDQIVAKYTKMENSVVAVKQSIKNAGTKVAQAVLPSSKSTNESVDKHTTETDSVVVVVPKKIDGEKQDQVAQDAAEALIKKNEEQGRNVVLVEADSNGNTTVLKGDLGQVKGNTKVEVVSHGDQLKGQEKNIANVIKKIDESTPGSEISRVNVDACTDCNTKGGESFGDGLTKQLAQKNMKPLEVASYSPGTKVHIDKDGNKYVKNESGEVTSIVKRTDGKPVSKKKLKKSDFDDSKALVNDDDWVEERIMIAQAMTVGDTFTKWNLTAEQSQEVSTRIDALAQIIADKQAAGGPVMLSLTFGAENASVNGTNPSVIKGGGEELGAQANPDFEGVSPETQVINIHFDSHGGSGITSESNGNVTTVKMDAPFPLGNEVGSSSDPVAKAIQLKMLELVRGNTANGGELVVRNFITEKMYPGMVLLLNAAAMGVRLHRRGNPDSDNGAKIAYINQYLEVSTNVRTTVINALAGRSLVTKSVETRSLRELSLDQVLPQRSPQREEVAASETALQTSKLEDKDTLGGCLPPCGGKAIQKQIDDERRAQMEQPEYRLRANSTPLVMNEAALGHRTSYTKNIIEKGGVSDTANKDGHSTFLVEAGITDANGNTNADADAIYKKYWAKPDQKPAGESQSTLFFDKSHYQGRIKKEYGNEVRTGRAPMLLDDGGLLGIQVKTESDLNWLIPLLIEKGLKPNIRVGEKDGEGSWHSFDDYLRPSSSNAESVVVVLPKAVDGGEQDQVAQDAASALIKKNKEQGRKVVLVEADAQGNITYPDGALANLSGNTKVEVVSHGDQLKGQAERIASAIEAINNQTTGDTVIQRVNVDACTTCSAQNEREFAADLTLALSDKTDDVIEVASYSEQARLHVTPEGEKQVENVNGGEVFSVVRKTHQGEGGLQTALDSTGLNKKPILDGDEEGGVFGTIKGWFSDKKEPVQTANKKIIDRKKRESIERFEALKQEVAISEIALNSAQGAHKKGIAQIAHQKSTRKLAQATKKRAERKQEEKVVQDGRVNEPFNELKTVYRADNRTPAQILKAQGFMPFEKDVSTHRKKVQDIYSSKEGLDAKALMIDWIKHPNKHRTGKEPHFVATSRDPDTSGQKAIYKYQIDVEAMKLAERSVKLSKENNKHKKEDSYPELVMNDNNINSADIMAMAPKQGTKEITFISGIPARFITGYKLYDDPGPFKPLTSYVAKSDSKKTVTPLKQTKLNDKDGTLGCLSGPCGGKAIKKELAEKEARELAAEKQLAVAPERPQSPKYRIREGSEPVKMTEAALGHRSRNTIPIIAEGAITKAKAQDKNGQATFAVDGLTDADGITNTAADEEFIRYWTMPDNVSMAKTKPFSSTFFFKRSKYQDSIDNGGLVTRGGTLIKVGRDGLTLAEDSLLGIQVRNESDLNWLMPALIKKGLKPNIRVGDKGEGNWYSFDSYVNKTESVVVMVPDAKTGGQQDQTVKDAVAALVQKNQNYGRNVVLVGVDSKGNITSGADQLNGLSGNTKIELVSHGSELVGQAEAMAKAIERVNQEAAEATIQRVNVDACTTCSAKGERAFAAELTDHLTKKIDTAIEVASLSEKVKMHVTPEGEKQFQSTDGKEVSSVVRKTHQGEEVESALKGSNLSEKGTLGESNQKTLAAKVVGFHTALRTHLNKLTNDDGNKNKERRLTLTANAAHVPSGHLRAVEKALGAPEYNINRDREISTALTKLAKSNKDRRISIAGVVQPESKKTSDKIDQEITAKEVEIVNNLVDALFKKDIAKSREEAFAMATKEATDTVMLSTTHQVYQLQSLLKLVDFIEKVDSTPEGQTLLSSPHAKNNKYTHYVPNTNTPREAIEKVLTDVTKLLGSDPQSPEGQKEAMRNIAELETLLTRTFKEQWEYLSYVDNAFTVLNKLDTGKEPKLDQIKTDFLEKCNTALGTKAASTVDLENKIREIRSQGGIIPSKVLEGLFEASYDLAASAEKYDISVRYPIEMQKDLAHYKGTKSFNAGLTDLKPVTNNKVDLNAPRSPDGASQSTWNTVRFLDMLLNASREEQKAYAVSQPNAWVAGKEGKYASVFEKGKRIAGGYHDLMEALATFPDAALNGQDRPARDTGLENALNGVEGRILNSDEYTKAIKGISDTAEIEKIKNKLIGKAKKEILKDQPYLTAAAKTLLRIVINAGLSLDKGNKLVASPRTSKDELRNRDLSHNNKKTPNESSDSKTQQASTEGVTKAKVTGNSRQVEVEHAQVVANERMRTQLQRDGYTIVENDGGDNRVDCLIISLVQHATGDYANQHPDRVRELRELIVNRFGEDELGRLNTDGRVMDLLAGELDLRVNVLQAVGDNEQVEATNVAQTGNGRREVTVWDQTGHVEAVYRPEQESNTLVTRTQENKKDSPGNLAKQTEKQEQQIDSVIIVVPKGQEKDPTVAAATQALVKKNDDQNRETLVIYEDDAGSQGITKQLAKLSGNTKIEMVAHGDSVKGRGEELAGLLNSLAERAANTNLKRVNLDNCSTCNRGDDKESLGQVLTDKLGDRFKDTEVAEYSAGTKLHVDKAGRKEVKNDGAEAHSVIRKKVGGEVVVVSRKQLQKSLFDDNVALNETIKLSPNLKANFEGHDLKNAQQIIEKEQLFSEPLVVSTDNTDPQLTYEFSKVFSIEGGTRLAVLAVVKGGGNDGTLRMFYQSGSTGVFRLMPSVAKDKKGKNWFNKGFGEETLTLPWKIQKQLATRVNEEYKSIPDLENDFKAFVVNHESIDGALSWNGNGRTFDPSTSTRLFDESNENRVKDKTGHNSHLLPEAHTPRDNKKIPDFSKEPVDTYNVMTQLHGEVTAMRYLSEDGTSYTVMKNKENKIWIADIAHLKTDVDVDYGIPAEVLNGEGVTMPLWEYPDQIPQGFESGIINGEYESSWRYLREIPLIQAWYQQTGTTMPQKYDNVVVMAPRNQVGKEQNSVVEEAANALIEKNKKKGRHVVLVELDADGDFKDPKVKSELKKLSGNTKIELVSHGSELVGKAQAMAEAIGEINQQAAKATILRVNVDACTTCSANADGKEFALELTEQLTKKIDNTLEVASYSEGSTLLQITDKGEKLVANEAPSGEVHSVVRSTSNDSTPKQRPLERSDLNRKRTLDGESTVPERTGMERFNEVVASAGGALSKAGEVLSNAALTAYNHLPSFSTQPPTIELSPGLTPKFEGRSASEAKALIEQHKLFDQPLQRTITFGETSLEYTVSKVFQDDSGHLAVMAVVKDANNPEAPGVLRAFYRSNSSGLFRLLPAVKSTNGWYDKGFGEDHLNLPWDTQKLLAEQAGNQGYENIPVIEEGLESVVRVYDGKENDAKSRAGKEDGMTQPVKRDFNPMAKANMYRTDKSLKSLGLVEPKYHKQIRRKNFDFSSEPIDSYTFHSDVYGGEVKAMLYRNRSGMELTLLQANDGKVWVGAISSDKFAIDGTHSVRRAFYESYGLTMPLREYPSQIPEAYQSGDQQEGYASSWAYVHEMPLIKAWYEQTGTPMPAVEENIATVESDTSEG